MPSPSLRNRGESLAEKVEGTRHTNHLPDRRDRLHSNRDRAAQGWEAAASTLDARAASTLEGRARAEREAHQRLYEARVRLRLPDVRLTPPATARPARGANAGPRYWLGHCLRCDVELWTFNAKSRVPVCAQCRARDTRVGRLAD